MFGLDPHTIGEILSVVMFLTVIFLLMIGYPVAFSLGGASLLFGFLGHAYGAFDLQLLGALPNRFWGVMNNEVLVAVPLFIFMGVMLERSRIAEVLLTTMGQIFGGLRGGLGYSVIIVGAMLAASTGIVGATVVTMGLLSLPAMLRAGYDPKLATGIICASGTLGQIIPPSTVLIFVGDVLQGANTQAQAEKGNFAPDPVSVGDLFAGAFIPGFLLVGLYIAWVCYRSIVEPASCPPLKMTAQERAGLGRRVVIALIPPIFLIIAVLGSILAGIATPTESASVGALGAILLTVIKMAAEKIAGERHPEIVEKELFWFWIIFMLILGVLVALFHATGLLTALGVVLLAVVGFVAWHRDTRTQFVAMLLVVMRSTMMVTSMVFIILLGASVFSLIFRGLGGDLLVEQFLAQMPGGAAGAVLVVMLIMFILGFFLDTFEIIFIVVPIAGPILLKLDVDPVWLGVIIGVNLQTSFLTPPFGFSLFYLRGVAPPQVTTGHIYRGIIPFVGMQVLCMFLMWNFPRVATWLPDVIYRSGPALTTDAPGSESAPDQDDSLTRDPSQEGGDSQAPPQQEDDSILSQDPSQPQN
ncbi:MAG TPA: TRAP transporter large permease subunit [Alphaproteobacteria bacterium]|nr:TRAP transporter large permease subunit [Alphaproteobacteria bacterium]